MLYFQLTNGEMVKWWMVKCCNGEIKIKIGHLFSHKYQICPFVLFSNTTFLQQIKQYIPFNFWSLTTSKATKIVLSNQATNESWCFIRGQKIIVREIVTLIYIVWIQQSLAIHYCNQPVLAITLELYVTYSI